MLPLSAAFRSVAHDTARLSDLTSQHPNSYVPSDRKDVTKVYMLVRYFI